MSENINTIGDLFFMLDHRKYWKLVETSEEDALDELFETATEFCENMELLGHVVNPNDVMDDFLERSW